MRTACLVILATCAASAQTFDVVSIKRSDGSVGVRGARARPDGFAAKQPKAA